MGNGRYFLAARPRTYTNLALTHSFNPPPEYDRISEEAYMSDGPWKVQSCTGGGTMKPGCQMHCYETCASKIAHSITNLLKRLCAVSNS